MHLLVTLLSVSDAKDPGCTASRSEATEWKPMVRDLSLCASVVCVFGDCETQVQPSCWNFQRQMVITTISVHDHVAVYSNLFDIVLFTFSGSGSYADPYPYRNTVNMNHVAGHPGKGRPGQVHLLQPLWYSPFFYSLWIRILCGSVSAILSDNNKSWPWPCCRLSRQGTPWPSASTPTSSIG
jgi:hypothetical protein